MEPVRKGYQVIDGGLGYDCNGEDGDKWPASKIHFGDRTRRLNYVLDSECEGKIMFQDDPWGFYRTWVESWTLLRYRRSRSRLWREKSTVLLAMLSFVCHLDSQEEMSGG